MASTWPGEVGAAGWPASLTAPNTRLMFNDQTEVCKGVGSTVTGPVARRTVLRGLFAATAGSLISGCTGFATTGTSGLAFLSTQFQPVEEAERFRAILRGAYAGEVSYVTAEAGAFATQVRSQVDAGSVQVSLLGGLHGHLAPFAGRYLEDLTDLLPGLGDRGWSAEYLRLARAGTDRTWYVPWGQASYVLAAHAEALRHLPSGVDINALTYDQLLDWAIAARRANGDRPMLGLPAGPKGLYYRFLQGYLYPSFTGAQVTAFRSADAVTAWQYLKELWANCVPTSTTYDYMQEPLASGEVRMAWDHVARLTSAPKRDPQNWRMFPAPAGPKGRGYMAVLTGLAIPKGAADQEAARRLIRTLSDPGVQVEVLRANAFFPTVNAATPADLSPALRLSADAVVRQQTAADAILSLPPVGVGARDGEVSKVFTDCFQRIVLGGADIRSTLDSQATVLRNLLRELKAPCWAPDPDSADAVCEVG
jgi:multiple sugar transport system substrate-binding protein